MYDVTISAEPTNRISDIQYERRGETEGEPKGETRRGQERKGKRGGYTLYVLLNSSSI